MATVTQVPPSDHLRRLVAELYGERDTTFLDAPAPTALDWAQAVADVSTVLCQRLRLDAPHPRLQRALELVLAHAVTLHPDHSASVQSGSRTYTLAPHCSCPDAKNRSEMCKHALAVEVHRRALALLEGTAHAPAPAATCAPLDPVAVPVAASAAGVPVALAPTSAAWNVQEAPTSACFKWRIGQGELLYTFRGVNDAEVLSRIREQLPLLQDILEAYEARATARAAAQAQTQQAQAQALTLTPDMLQALQALLAPSAGVSIGPASTGQAARRDAGPPHCPEHGAMRESTKAPGTWYCTKKRADGSYCTSKA